MFPKPFHTALVPQSIIHPDKIDRAQCSSSHVQTQNSIFSFIRCINTFPNCERTSARSSKLLITIALVPFSFLPPVPTNPRPVSTPANWRPSFPNLCLRQHVVGTLSCSRRECWEPASRPHTKGRWYVVHFLWSNIALLFTETCDLKGDVFGFSWTKLATLLCRLS